MLRLTVLSLMMAAMLVNCKDKDETEPTTIDPEIGKQFDNIAIASPTLDQPAEVKVTEASIEASAKATEVNGALGSIAGSGTVPASVSTAGAEVKSAISDSEINTLNSVNSATVAAVAAGGALSPELKAILDKAMANPAVAAYLPKFTFPVVEGVTLRGTRVGATDAVEKVEKVLVTDACLADAQAKFDVVKARLDASKATETQKVTAAYNAAIQPIAGQQTACTDGLTAKYAEYRTSTQAQASAALADIEAAQGALGDLYPVLKALVNIQLLGALSSINTLQAADAQACVAKAAAATTNAQAAQTANLAKVEVAYTAALTEANTVKAAAVASCHNQGGGN